MALALAVRHAAELKPEIRLAQALSEYEAILQAGEKAELRSLRSAPAPGVSAVMEMTAAIDRSNAHRKSRRCFGPRLTNLLESVQQFSTIIDLIIGGSQSLIASAIWGTVKMTLQLTASFASYFDNLSALLMRIGQSCPRYRDYGLLHARCPRLQKALCEYFCTIVVLCKKAVIFIRKPFVAQLSSAILNPFRTEFGPLETRLSALANTVREEASLASQQVLSLDTREASAFRRLISSKAAEEMQAAKRLESECRKFRFLDTCSTYNHRTAWKRARKAGTSSWLRERPECKTWAQSASSNVLWCTGKLGSGKTVCMASLVEELVISFPNVAYFFCDHDHTESLEARNMIGSLARQFFSVLEPAAFDLIKSDESEHIDQDEVIASIQRLLPKDDHSYFILIDGLDECKDSELLKLWGGLHAILQSHQRFHVFCSSRPDMTLRDRPLLTSQLHVNLPEDNPEIAQYIDSALEDRLEAGSLSLGNPNIVHAIREALLKGSQGMFLWVVFQLDSICAELTDEAILNALLCLPRDLPETFDRILCKVQRERSTNPDLCRRIFALTVAAQRPLTTDELREALNIVPGETIWNPNTLVNDMQKALGGCGSLLTIDEEDFTVHFAHHSVRQYVISTTANPTMSEYHISSLEADQLMGAICVTYLNMNIFHKELVKTDRGNPLRPQAITSSVLQKAMPSRTANMIARKILKGGQGADFDLAARLEETFKVARPPPETHPFLGYASDFWLVHTKRFKSNGHLPYHLWRGLVNNSSAIVSLPWGPESWHQWPSKFFSYLVDNDHGALLHTAITRFLALRFSHELKIDWAFRELTDLVFAKGPDSSVDPHFYDSILSLADMLDESELRFFVQRGADVNVITRDGRTLLGWATQASLPWLLQLILNREDLVLNNDTKRDLNHALIRAIEMGWFDVAQSLLNRRDMHLLEDFRPLISCVLYNQSEIASILLEREDIMINRPDTQGNTPLGLALQFNNTEIVDLLYTRDDLDLLATNGQGQSLLILASRHDYAYVVNQCLRHLQINVNAADNTEHTALHWATQSGHTRIMELLLQREDIDINARNQSKRTALMYATEHIDVRAAKILLQREKIDINAKDAAGKTALIHAAEQDRVEVVKLLIQQEKIDINGKDTDGRTALMYAAERDRIEVVRLLIQQRKIDVNARDGAGQTALGHAVVQNHVEVVKLLIRQEFTDVNMRDVTGCTALMYAVKECHVSMVKLLLEQESVDVNAINNSRMAAMGQAAEIGATNILELLLTEKNIDVNHRDAQGRSALLIAAYSLGHRPFTHWNPPDCCHEVMGVLLKRPDVNVNVKGTIQPQNTTLHEAVNCGDLDAVNLLLKRSDIDTEIVNADGRTPLALAEALDYKDVVKTLKAHKAQMEQVKGRFMTLERTNPAPTRRVSVTRKIVP